MSALLAIIGGTGLYELPGLEQTESIDAETPFGAASGPIRRGRLNGRDLLFLARHGSGHRLLPHEINYRANVFALKRAGATHVLSVSAVGSLDEVIAPGHFALPSQYIDWTRGARLGSFFGAGVAAHVSTAEPVSAAMLGWITAACAGLPGVTTHARDVTYACVEGPRLGTRAESRVLRQFGAQLVGMSNVPEVFLAREAQMAYASIGVVTDYDCWREDPDEIATLSAILERYRASLDRAKALLHALAATPLPEVEPTIRQALQDAVITPDPALDDAQRDWLAVLRR